MKIDVLDHGYAELVESWGSDELSDRVYDLEIKK